jgi:hypothetical protein
MKTITGGFLLDDSHDASGFHRDNWRDNWRTNPREEGINVLV